MDERGVGGPAAGLAARSQLSTEWGWQGTVARDRQARHKAPPRCRCRPAAAHAGVPLLWPPNAIRSSSQGPHCCNRV